MANHSSKPPFSDPIISKNFRQFAWLQPGTQSLMTISNQQSSVVRQKKPRPLGVTLLTLGVLSIASLNLLRLVDAIRLWGFLGKLLPISPLYLALTGLIAGGAGLILVWGLWKGREWAPPFCRLASLAYIMYYWLDRLLLSNADSRRSNLPFSVGVTLVLLALVFWILSRPKAKAFFGDDYER
jgi:hypothetical protein